MEDNVTAMPAEETTVESTAPVENPSPILDEDGNEVTPLSKEEADGVEIQTPSTRDISKTIKQANEVMNVMESMWRSLQQEFNITDDQMKKIYQYNLDHREGEFTDDDNPPEEEEDKMRRYNGLDKITPEEVVEIFGEGHNIINMEHSITQSRLKECLATFIEYLCAVKEYKSLHEEYLELLEMQEERAMEVLKQRAEEETNPEEKEKMLKSIETYYDNKTLKFIGDPLTEQEIDRLVRVFHDGKTLEYYLNRSRTKLEQMKISSTIILELSKFESRYLPEKYHSQNNLLLVYYLSKVTFCRVGDKRDKTGSEIILMTLGLDNTIRNGWDKKFSDKVLEHIMQLEDQFIGKL